MLFRQLHEPEPWIATVDEVLTPSECSALIAHAEALGFDDAPITTRGGPVLNQAFRNNTRVMEDDPDRAADLWGRLEEVVPVRIEGWRAVGLNERFRIYRYEPGQFFRWHLDGAFQRSFRERSLVTLMIYLNEGFRGGRTEFDLIGDVEPERGMALLFQHCALHQGARVVEGVKYVLRTDVMYRYPG